MRVIITGGGTGGHVYPAIAIANKIMEKDPDNRVLFVGTKRGIESRLVPAAGYEIKFVESRGINRKNLVKNIKVAVDYFKGKRQAAQIINDFKPDVVIGTGGYVSGAIVSVAAKMKIKSYIQEQNAAPGLTNKVLESKVKNVFLGFPEAAQYFKEGSKHIVTGNPVLKEFFETKKEVARKRLKIDEDVSNILIFGGSQGAGRINKGAISIIAKYYDNPKVTVNLICGNAYYDAMIEEMADRKMVPNDRIRLINYTDEMYNYMAAADIVICRSGALAVSEVISSGKVGIFIPSPNVTGNHQYFNAKSIAEKGGAILIEEKDLDDTKLIDQINQLLDDKEKLEEMSKIALESAPREATEKIYEYISVH